MSKHFKNDEIVLTACLLEQFTITCLVYFHGYI